MVVLVAVLVLPLPAAVGSSLLMLLLEFCSPTKRGSPCYVFCPSNGKRAGIPFRGRRPCFHFFPSCPDNYLGIPGSSCLRDNYLSVDHRTDQWVWWSGYELWPEGCELSISCLLRASAPCGNSLQRRLLGTRYYSGRPPRYPGYPSCLLATHQWPMALNSIILTHTLIIIRPFSA